MKLSRRVTAISMLIVIVVCMSGYVLLVPAALEGLGMDFLVPDALSDALKELGLTSADLFNNEGESEDVVVGGADSLETLEIAGFADIGGGQGY